MLCSQEPFHRSIAVHAAMLQQKLKRRKCRDTAKGKLIPEEGHAMQGTIPWSRGLDLLDKVEVMIDVGGLGGQKSGPSRGPSPSQIPS